MLKIYIRKKAMSDEKKIKTEELPDEQMEKVTGGFGMPKGDLSKSPKTCKKCGAPLPYNYSSELCMHCMTGAYEDTAGSLDARPKPIDDTEF